MTPKIFLINEEGISFVKKWERDTKLSVLVCAPAFLIFYLGCEVLIIGLTIKWILVSIPVMLYISLAFIYVPYFVRKKHVNRMVKEIVINDDKISLKTFKWFNFTPITLTTTIVDIKLEKIIDDRFFKNKKVLLITGLIFGGEKLYLIEDYFYDLNTLFDCNSAKLIDSTI